MCDITQPMQPEWSIGLVFAIPILLIPKYCAAVFHCVFFHLTLLFSVLRALSFIVRVNSAHVLVACSVI
jgi:hypothetical protein